ncbi:DoxX family protein [Ferruginibacter sp. HRS2-29]|uniref:DoxX family protein n=1 Tax=Ferruginibacter sp. HRS2-29 TaxID=2487334 RepID=UPI0020CF4D23|nr:DoxX family protein [Ferruginibacter sp. HRS2-29]MCP9752397.1 DoxX family protein [Ferruginibacter sp. HRS2-29]
MLHDTPPPQGKQSPQPKWLTIFRVILGFILIWKGYTFFKDSAALEEMIRGGGIEMFSNNTRAIAFIITYINLLGGVFIATGLFTRWMSLINIPVVVGAIIFVNSKAGMSFSNTELILSIGVLILLIIFVIKGSGTLSADEFFRSYTKAGMEQGHTKKLFQ